ncbi:MAG: response regulator transcription factor [Acidobacteria bacterium]|nr:response regulator transcription factor [Acidobacteriota bacterium]
MSTVGIVEDNATYREVLVDFLNQHFQCNVVAESVESFMAAVGDGPYPDVVLMDIELPGVSGIQGVAQVRERSPKTEVVMLTIFEDSDHVFDALCAGASGYMLKHSPLQSIKRSVEDAASHGSPMSPRVARKVLQKFFPQKEEDNSGLSRREQDVVSGLVEGLSYKEIGDRLFISVDTVRHHIRNIYRKLEVNSKTEVMQKYWRRET